jgi:hypothetical protein
MDSTYTSDTYYHLMFHVDMDVPNLPFIFAKPYKKALKNQIMQMRWKQ